VYECVCVGVWCLNITRTLFYSNSILLKLYSIRPLYYSISCSVLSSVRVCCLQLRVCCRLNIARSPCYSNSILFEPYSIRTLFYVLSSVVCVLLSKYRTNSMLFKLDSIRTLFYSNPILFDLYTSLTLFYSVAVCSKHRANSTLFYSALSSAVCPAMCCCVLQHVVLQSVAVCSKYLANSILCCRRRKQCMGCLPCVGSLKL